jgi:hypothetical protein
MPVPSNSNPRSTLLQFVKVGFWKAPDSIEVPAYQLI